MTHSGAFFGLIREGGRHTHKSMQFLGAIFLTASAREGFIFVLKQIVHQCTTGLPSCGCRVSAQTV